MEAAKYLTRLEYGWQTRREGAKMGSRGSRRWHDWRGRKSGLLPPEANAADAARSGQTDERCCDEDQAPWIPATEANPAGPSLGDRSGDDVDDWGPGDHEQEQGCSEKDKQGGEVRPW